MSRKGRDHHSKGRTLVRGPDGASPFLRGMLTHSLIKQGLSFEEAYNVALAVRQQIAPLDEITLEELRSLIQQTIAEKLGQKRVRRLEMKIDAPHVRHNGGSVPFSRGLLSQRLAGTGLDPRGAYEVAQETWNRLRAANLSEIDHQALGRLVREILVERHGESFGQRYDGMLHIERSERPIIVLIGGATGSGKSTLATEIAYRLGIRKISSTDLIREIMRMLLSEEILPAIHASSYAYVPSRPGLSNPLLEGFREQVERVEVGIAASIRRAVFEGFHLVVEGVHLVPPMRPALQFWDEAIIVRLVLATFDRSLLEARFRQRRKESKHRGDKKYLGAIDSIWRIQEHILEMADQYDVPIIKNAHFDETVSDILRLVTDHIHRVRSEKETPA
jgi:2-phosphoglycerate kinase